MSKKITDNGAALREVVPAAPEIRRRLRFYKYQIVALPLLLLVPVLTLLGILGDATGTVDAREGDIALHVQYPSITRSRTYGEVLATVRNQSAQPVTGVELIISRDYLDGARQVQSVPSIDVVDDVGYRIELGDIAPGDARSATFSFLATQQGWQSGLVIVAVEGRATLQVDISAFVFP